MLFNVWYEIYVLESQKLDLEQRHGFLHQTRGICPTPPHELWIMGLCNIITMNNDWKT